MTASRFDLAVIGAGEAGIAAAVRAAELGARVALLEKSPQLGGACVATGTLPSKTFSLSANMFELAGRLKHFGVLLSGEPALDFGEVAASRQRLVRCDQGVIQSHLRANKVEIIRGSASFLAPDRIAVRREGGEVIEVAAPLCVLATGSRPTSLPGLPADGRLILTTDDIVGLTEVPSPLLIIGAGIIGCEYAFIFRTFGAEIILVELLDRCLPGQDDEIARIIEKELARRGVRFLPSNTVSGWEEAASGGLSALTSGGERLAAAKAVVCTGRRPFTAGLELQAAGVATGKRGEVPTDSRLRTSAPGIFAAGDVLGRRMQSSTAILEGGVAAENALGGDREPDERFVPSGIYTMPEIGAVGLTEAQAAASGRPVLVGKCPYAGLVKACSLYAYNPGLIKLVFDRESTRLLGAHIVGAEAAEIVHALALALKLGARAEDLAYGVYHHPSISEGLREAARDALSGLKS
ncbi:MAG: NAD(P)/FAD-dependent oxidoreductase [Candidatus Aminicenantes bacterium]|nr:NAD(P)/FAD-dependent oxidoreductase [Candidatus Aminicenantes bacterium]